MRLVVSNDDDDNNQKADDTGDQLNCIICLSSPPSEPATIDCALHNFCYACIARHMLGARTCPFCLARVTFIKTATAHRVVAAFGAQLPVDQEPSVPAAADSDADEDEQRYDFFLRAAVVNMRPPTFGGWHATLKRLANYVEDRARHDMRIFSSEFLTLAMMTLFAFAVPAAVISLSFLYWYDPWLTIFCLCWRMWTGPNPRSLSFENTWRRVYRMAEITLSLLDIILYCVQLDGLIGDIVTVCRYSIRLAWVLPMLYEQWLARYAERYVARERRQQSENV